MTPAQAEPITAAQIAVLIYRTVSGKREWVYARTGERFVWVWRIPEGEKLRNVTSTVNLLIRRGYMRRQVVPGTHGLMRLRAEITDKGYARLAAAFGHDIPEEP